MQSARETWTDEALDDLSMRVDRGFEKVDQDIRELRADMNARFGRLERVIYGFGGIVIAAFLGAYLSGGI
jgi:hypothetical protein